MSATASFLSRARRGPAVSSARGESSLRLGCSDDMELINKVPFSLLLSDLTRFVLHFLQLLLLWS